MSKRKGKSKDVEEPTSDSQIDYTFDENSDNPFIPRPRVSQSPILTRSRARNPNFSVQSKENLNNPSDSRSRIAQGPIMAQFRDVNLPASLHPAESAVNMGNENEGSNLPTSGSQQVQSAMTNANDLNNLTARLEHVLTLNHNAFMGEISSLRHSLVGTVNRNSNPYNNQPPNPNYPGVNGNTSNNNSFHNHSINTESGRSTSSNDSVRMEKWNVTYDGSDDVNDFLFKVNTLKERYNSTDNYISSNFHTLLKGKADTWFWSFLKQHPNANFDELKLALTKQFGKLENDCDKLVRMIERRQMPKESFDDYYSDMIAMNVRLSQPMNEAKLIDLIKNNVKESLGSLLFATDLFSLDHLRDCARKAEKYVSRQQQLRFRKMQVSELETIENTDAIFDEDEEIAALKYQANHNKERKDLDTRHYKCWNCDQIGHSFYDCPVEKRNLFCFRCGEKNITTPQCKKHSKNRNTNE